MTGARDDDDFAFEPVPGLPARLPPGETLLWQGSPEWRSLAVSAFHIRKVALYFVALIAWHGLSAFGAGPSATFLSILPLLVGGMATVAILGFLAFLYARGTIYTLTTRRFVFRSGLALPVTLNLPLALIDGAAVTGLDKAAGSIALELAKPNRVAFLVLWPNARPWRFLAPQPTLRCIPDVETVAALVSRALEAQAGAATARRPGRVPPQAAGEAAFPAAGTVAA